MLKSSSRLQPSKTDTHPTPTSDEQLATETLLSQFITENNPKLDTHAHLNFLVRMLVQGFPARYVAYDASQPWLLFWIMQSVSLLGAGMDPENKQKIIDTLLACQHPSGGFGGGPYQFPHLLTTYASVCTLAIVGRPGPNGGWDQIDREKMYEFFLSLKQPDGSFLVAKDMEVDVRGTYCLLAVATLLDILTPALAANVPEFIASCQTYEGGLSSASQPSIASIAYTRPLGEAHGGYTSCALASYVLLKQAHLVSDRSAKLDLANLVRWLVHLQGEPMELGGFKGRTNKLVDGCYSWWVGGSFTLLECLGVPSHHPIPDQDEQKEKTEGEGDEKDWEDADESLFDKTALQEYLLFGAQSEAGGLRDKPKKSADAYHTLYCLAGLSNAQHRIVPSPSLKSQLLSGFKETTSSLSGKLDPKMDLKNRKEVYSSSLSWIEDEGSSKYVGGKGNRVNACHPLFNLTVTHVKGIMNHFYGQS